MDVGVAVGSRETVGDGVVVAVATAALGTGVTVEVEASIGVEVAAPEIPSVVVGLASRSLLGPEHAPRMRDAMARVATIAT
jgi:hypothetical protein